MLLGIPMNYIGTVLAPSTENGGVKDARCYLAKSIGNGLKRPGKDNFNLNEMNEKFGFMHSPTWIIFGQDIC